MSKHFELLQELEKEQTRRPEPISAPVFPPEELIARSSGDSKSMGKR